MTGLYAGWATAILTLSIMAITLFVARAAQPARPIGAVLARLYRIRARYFVLLVTLLVATIIGTIPLVPYPSWGSAEPDARIVATAYMWYWELEPGEETTVEMTEDGAIRLSQGMLVEFQVTGADVNHNFGLYDEAGLLVAQTQAMPGYTNRLRYRFKRAGTYQILCLEYCGLAHHAMTSEIVVAAAPTMPAGEEDEQP